MCFTLSSNEDAEIIDSGGRDFIEQAQFVLPCSNDPHRTHLLSTAETTVIGELVAVVERGPGL
jgi:hypothetical protein